MLLKNKPKLEQISICVPPSWIRWFERQAAAEERTLSEFLRRYIKERAPDWVRLIESDTEFGEENCPKSAPRDSLPRGD